MHMLKYLISNNNNTVDGKCLPVRFNIWGDSIFVLNPHAVAVNVSEGVDVV